MMVKKRRKWKKNKKVESVENSHHSDTGNLEMGQEKKGKKKKKKRPKLLEIPKKGEGTKNEMQEVIETVVEEEKPVVEIEEPKAMKKEKPDVIEKEDLKVIEKENQKVKEKEVPKVIEKEKPKVIEKERKVFPHDIKLSEQQNCICQQHHIIVMKPTPKIQRLRYYCDLCSYVCDSWGSLEKHIVRNNHISALQDFIDDESIKLLPPPLDKQIGLIGGLLKYVISMYGIRKTKERKILADRVKESVSKSFEGCTVNVYGSTLYYAGLISSDVNLNVSIPTSLNLPNTMKAIFEHLKSDTSNYRDVKFNMASVTSITFEDCSSNLRCCVTFNNNRECEVAQIILTYLSLDERAMMLATVFRCWGHLCCLDQIDYGTLPPHAFPILVIYYLQQLEDPVLPVLNKEELLGEDSAAKATTDSRLLNWKSSNKMRIGELWLGLFKFYLMEMDFNDKVVSITSKDPVYQISKKWSCRKFGIEDPVNPDRNIAKTLANLKSVNYLVSCLRSSTLYFATPQMQFGPIFRRVQQLPPGMIRLQNLLQEREQFLKYIFESHPYFQSEQDLKMKNVYQLMDPKHPNFSDIGKFIVTPEQANLLVRRFNPAYLFYDFHFKYFTGGKERPIVCVFCREEGHYKDKCPWDSLPPLEKLPHLPDSDMEKLNEMCQAVYDTWVLTPAELAKRESIVSHLLNFLRDHFPDAKLTLFGSSCNGFGLKQSDIDICFTFTSCPPDEVPDLDFGQLIQDLHVILKSYPPFTNLVPITTAKVPILKFFHLETNLDGDISFHNTLALENTKLISTYSKIDERAKVLGYVVKRFAKISNICDASRGSLSSYAYILMMIHFLQQCNPPVLPVLQEICRPSSTEEHILENCDVYFFADVERLPSFWPEYGKNKKSVGELWIEFLCFYTEVFNFNEFVINIRRKRPLLKFEKLWNAKSMAIEDPFDVGHNLGVGLSLKMHQYILKAFINGRMYFSTSENMPVSKPVSKEAEQYFDGSRVKGNPPDRGCHYCKRIGHIMKDCPGKAALAKSREHHKDPFANFVNKTKHHQNAVRGGSRGNPGVDGNMRKDAYRHEKGRKTTWWNRNIPTAQPVVSITCDPHKTTRPVPLNRAKVPAEIEKQLKTLAQKWNAGPEHKEIVHQEVKRNVNHPSPQKPVGKVIDVYTQPSDPVGTASKKKCDESGKIQE